MYQLKDRLNLLVESARISRDELARVSGVHRSVVHRICQGLARDVSARTVVRIAEATGCSVDWLCGRPVEGPTPIALRYHLSAKGATLREKKGEREPINANRDTSRRGRVAREQRGPQSVVIESDRTLPPAPIDDDVSETEDARV